MLETASGAGDIRVLVWEEAAEATAVWGVRGCGGAVSAGESLLVGDTSRAALSLPRRTNSG